MHEGHVRPVPGCARGEAADAAGFPLDKHLEKVIILIVFLSVLPGLIAWWQGRRAAKAVAKKMAMPRADLEKLLTSLEAEMFEAADQLKFEYAAKLRDEIKLLRRELEEAEASAK